ncbi:MAG: iron-containing alcohol dehydrogenase [Muribaculaceae bacterium]|jgi:alcohol dehydrogenase YqhD (iron-dependent ADH family)|nr:iron-containing alcohol dehydrogenase [Muribaculaceae bacterium]MBQ2399086.1 iron-containing alcohol dehydrogenase [Muribaculaceae bacterium]MBQ5697195.1 iron-containing alcohol dehydrogenase [Muribaculaceae bacterium]MBR4886863.1 iron-containing alcohol dehydrogenase [Muribaculaceae bacterium]MBR5787165.1 iron-containing alcohol dehydrogenase [Muribaculaceae bacterium]
MENFVFYSPTEFVFGRDTQSQTGELVKRYGGRRVLVVYGGGSVVRSGLLDTVKASLDAEGITYCELSGIRPNPTDDRVYEGIEIARKEGVDFILAVGGGSVIDTAKGIAIGVPYDGDFWDFYSKKGVPTASLPVGVVLTIPAAGSEGSGNSVITKLDGMHKISVRYPMMLRPRFAVMNPELTYTLPWFQTACGIVDMICHIQERYFSNTTGVDLTDGIAETIMRNVMQNALRLKENPNDYDARANVMWAGTLAHNGLCGNGKVEDWSSHRLEHEISALYDVAHGAGLAVMVPAWMTFVAKKNPHKVREFAVKVMGIEAEGKSDEMVIAEGIEALKAFYHSIDLTTSMRELTGVENPDIEALVKSLNGNMGDTLGFYVPLSMEDCAEIYRLAL